MTAVFVVMCRCGKCRVVQIDVSVCSDASGWKQLLQGSSRLVSFI